MSEGIFLIGQRGVISSEKIIKTKALLKEGIDIDAEVQVDNTEQNENINSLLNDVDIVNYLPETLKFQMIVKR